MSQETEKALTHLRNMEPVLWLNDRRRPAREVLPGLGMQFHHVIDASQRLDRFAPFLSKVFPETGNGLVESLLTEVPDLKNALAQRTGTTPSGKLFVKRDSELPVAGSLKARGGLYEILRHAERLALDEGLLLEGDDYRRFASDEFRNFFSRHSVAVGSTGNLGLSIGITAATLGFRASVHMSRDAKPWKKSLLRQRGVEVVEYEGDYSVAVEGGRRRCLEDTRTYFVDDERSLDLFLGYAVAALRLRNQLEQHGIDVSEDSPLNVFLPCGVGGAPGGITFGLKHLFGDSVRCFLAEPTHAPCMLLAMLTDNPDLSVEDIGLDNVTEADGLAVGTPSKPVFSIIRELVDGCFTVNDDDLFRFMALLHDEEGLKAEPSAMAGLGGMSLGLGEFDGTHLAWLTGGLFLPDGEYKTMLERGRDLLKG